MGRVDEVKRVGRSRRWAVVVDGEVALEAEAETLARFRVTAGKELDEAELGEMREADEALQAGQAAARLLKVRGRSRQELARALGRKGYGEAAVSLTLERLERAGLVNDEELAGRLADSLRERKLGTRVVRQKMLQAGLGRELTEETLTELGDEGEAGRALALGEKYVARSAGEDPARLRRRLYGYLARRGFDDGVCREVLETVVPAPD
jgi:regulatory protein